jgi:hypothetical protein
MNWGHCNTKENALAYQRTGILASVHQRTDVIFEKEQTKFNQLNVLIVFETVK